MYTTNFSAFQRTASAAIASWALSFVFIGHRLVSYFMGRNFYPNTFSSSKWLFFFVVAFVQVTVFTLLIILVRAFEKSMETKLIKKTRDLASIGPSAMARALAVASIELCAAVILVVLDPTLLNIWDTLFVFIFIGILYVGTNFYFYYGIPLSCWASRDYNLEIEKLKMEYDLQKVYMKAFLWITFSILVSQVFVILKSRFEPYLSDPKSFSYLMPSIMVNAIQLCFIIFAIWVLVFSVLLARIDQIKCRLSSIYPEKTSTKRTTIEYSSDEEIEPDILE